MSQILESVYLDATSTIRHYDSQRDSSGNFFMAILSGLLALSQFAGQHGATLCAAMVALSLLFFLFQRKLAYLIELQRARARTALEKLSQQDREVAEVNKTARQTVMKAHPVMGRIRTSWLWDSFYMVFFLLGLVLLVHG